MSHRLHRSVSNICAGTTKAFAAIRKNGSVVTWGDPLYGGDSSAVQDQLHDVVEIFATDAAFVALRHDGSAVTWGCDSDGAVPKETTSNTEFGKMLTNGLTSVVTITASRNRFAALRKDGSVLVWGGMSENYISLSTRPPHIREEDAIVAIVASDFAFAARHKGGSVTTWGGSAYGGDCSSVTSELKNVVDIFATRCTFAALRIDGSVVTWGGCCGSGDDEKRGGARVLPVITRTRTIKIKEEKDDNNNHSISVASALQECSGGGGGGGIKTVCISGTSNTFVAIKQNGSVVTCCGSGSGGGGGGNDGNGNGPPSFELTNVVRVCVSQDTFAAVHSDGSVKLFGGNRIKPCCKEYYRFPTNPKLEPELTDVVNIAATECSFAAVCRDGSVITWSTVHPGCSSLSHDHNVDHPSTVNNNGSSSSAVLSLHDDVVVLAPPRHQCAAAAAAAAAVWWWCPETHSLFHQLVQRNAISTFWALCCFKLPFMRHPHRH